MLNRLQAAYEGACRLMLEYLFFAGSFARISISGFSLTQTVPPPACPFASAPGSCHTMQEAWRGRPGLVERDQGDGAGDRDRGGVRVGETEIESDEEREMERERDERERDRQAEMEGLSGYRALSLG